jgi:uncharacterized cupin superfamily protein
MPTKYTFNESFRLHGGLLLGLSVVIAQLAIPPALANARSEQQTLSPGPRSPGAMLPSHGNSAALPGEMLVYSPKKPVDLSTLVSLGPPAALGGEVLTGNPRLYGRIDFQQGNMMGGLFMATTGLIRVTFPFTEHATIIKGKVTLTDETGKTRTFKEGDSYFIRQGSVILWDVRGPYVIKSFFNVTEPVAP